MADGAPPPVLEPCLLNEIRDFHDVVITAVFLPKGDGLISLSEDGDKPLPQFVLAFLYLCNQRKSHSSVSKISS
ncbi:hypothetical protein FQA47_015555 [Oryzias melastigma]|uniref:Uncharacterized protein n=1 Tax=Oryzias melastigma TaxID=30732 RepID=A0A834BXY0_ORYME|nr:hypothetical protein FQA47_015555 [Oryzias melastigma]